ESGSSRRRRPTQPKLSQSGDTELTCSLVVKSPMDTFRRIRPECQRQAKTDQLPPLTRRNLLAQEDAVVSALATACRLDISMTRVERLILGHRLIGEQPHLRQPKFPERRPRHG